MISLDFSIIPAIVLFLTLVFALNYLLFKPLLKVQAEREERTVGQHEQARRRLSHHLDLFNRYVAAIRNGRMEGYRLQEQQRSDAMEKGPKRSSKPGNGRRRWCRNPARQSRRR